MCLLAKINNKEFMCFYLNNGKVELRDEKFHATPLPEHMDSVWVKDSFDLSVEWRETTPTNLIRLARLKMRESLLGLKEIYHRSTLG